MVGFIGLGNMGWRMAACIARKLPSALPGRRLHVFDPRAEAVAHLTALGAVACPSPAAVWESAAVVLLCLPHGAAVEEVISGVRPREGTLVVDTSTTPPDTARRCAELLARSGARFVDAPVTGLPQRAEKGTLTSIVGGGAEEVEAARSVIALYSSEVVHVGPTGSGQLCKAFNNCVYNINVAAMAEMLPLARRLGLSPEKFAEVVSTGSGRSFGFQQWAPSAVAPRGGPEGALPGRGFPMENGRKDFETVLAAAQGAGCEGGPLLAAALRTYDDALAMGLGKEHKGAMVKVHERRLGVSCAADAPAAKL
eukprot:TRINITY_DN7330_c0_g2_i2.p1 TRINITY_DN7330_c0_g2~~TRINITY_DN7330_c0_g2_i2.p1  ORF type:complete len:310 (+),score=93.83 TRINITY_DN7330_c0_g2_i2:91-1020(+)